MSSFPQCKLLTSPESQKKPVTSFIFR